jgi:hypothetical protein
MQTFQYNMNFEPPAATTNIIISAATLNQIIKDGVKTGPVTMLLDTGADKSIIPKAIIRELENVLGLELPYGYIVVEDYHGTPTSEPTYKLNIFSEIKCINDIGPIEFIAINGDEGIFGRDVLNECSICLEGPSLKWSDSCQGE